MQGLDTTRVWIADLAILDIPVRAKKLYWKSSCPKNITCRCFQISTDIRAFVWKCAETRLVVDLTAKPGHTLSEDQRDNSGIKQNIPNVLVCLNFRTLRGYTALTRIEFLLDRNQTADPRWSSVIPGYPWESHKVCERISWPSTINPGLLYMARVKQNNHRTS